MGGGEMDLSAAEAAGSAFGSALAWAGYLFGPIGRWLALALAAYSAWLSLTGRGASRARDPALLLLAFLAATGGGWVGESLLSMGAAVAGEKPFLAAAGFLAGWIAAGLRRGGGAGEAGSAAKRGKQGKE